MKLKEKTRKKFVEFFSEQNRVNQEKEFEIAFSEIQRTTGTASVTLKRALNTLVEDGYIAMIPGRNSRYAKFTVLNPIGSKTVANPVSSASPEKEEPSLTSLEQEVDLLKRRLRSQEIAISLLQDRLANIEDKI